MSRIISLGAFILAVSAATVTLGAQAPTTASLRSEIQQAVRAYVDAVNRADAAALAEMYSREAGVTSVGDGAITRGWDAIRSFADSIAGKEGKYKVSTGSIDVVPLGSGYALALTSTIVTVGEQGAQLRGAMTLVFKKSGSEWKIIHDHTSTVVPATAPGGGAAARPTAPSPAPTPPPAATPVANPPPAAPSVITVAVANGQAVEIQPQKLVHYTFHLPPGVCVVVGRIAGISGGGKDFEALIMDEDNFQNWSAGHQANVYWQSGRVVVANIENAAITGPGTFHLVISNVFSAFTAKTVQAEAVARCTVG